MANDTARLSKAFLTSIAKRVNELIMETFDDERFTELSKYTPSERFVSAMEGILKKTKKRRISKPLKTMIIIAAILALIGGCALGAAAIRRAKLNYEIVDEGKFIIIDWYHEIPGNGVVVEKVNEIEIQYEPTYIPKGFVALYRKSFDISYMVTYQKPYGQNDERCIFHQDLVSAISNVDTEDDTVYKFKIKGFPAFCIVDHINESVRLYWCDDYYAYSILYQSPDATMEEVIKMAESLKPVK